MNTTRHTPTTTHAAPARLRGRAATAALALIAAVLGLAAAPALAQNDFFPGLGESDFGGPSDSSGKVKVDLEAGATTVPPGVDLPLALVFDIAPPWHTWPLAGPLPAGMTTFENAIRTEYEITVSDPSAILLNRDFVQTPTLAVHNVDVGDGPQPFAMLEKRAALYFPAVVAPDAPDGLVTITAKVSYQACEEQTCLMPVFNEEHSITIAIDQTADGTRITPVAGFPTDLYDKMRVGQLAPTAGPVGAAVDEVADALADDAADSAASTASFLGLLGILFVAMIGGFLLNLTPCVLPVIPLKIMSLAQQGKSGGHTFMLGLAMVAGIIAFWMALGIAVGSISEFSTNQLFQYPVFTIGVGLVILVLSVAMCGLFSVGLPQWVYKINPSQDTLHGSFGFGVMTAVLSTPCTAPFMGAAIAAATVAQNIGIVLAVFFAIGAGMALPYLILAAKPSLVEKMPRTGPASELIKQVMGLLMLAVAAYFIGIGVSGLMQQPGAAASRAYWWVVALFAVGAGGWLAFRTIQITPRAGRRALFGGLGVLIMGVSIYGGVKFTAKGPLEWTYYTPERLEEQLDAGNVVVLKFTAEWCLNCHALEKTVINTTDVTKALQQAGVVPMKVDITSGDAVGNQLLHEMKWKSIPYLVIMRPDHSVAFAADWYTPGDVIAGIDTALAPAVASN